jgi:hypothetical protein
MRFLVVRAEVSGLVVAKNMSVDFVVRFADSTV